MTVFDKIVDFAGSMRDRVVKMDFFDTLNLMMKSTIKGRLSFCCCNK